MTSTTEDHVRGWALAPARLPREDVKTLRKLYAAAHAAPLPNPHAATVTATLHADREDQRKLALAKLGCPAPHVRVNASIGENSITVTVIADADPSERIDVNAKARVVAMHKFRRSTPINEWTRILGRHCRHALGVLAHLRTPTLAHVFFPSGVSKVS